MARNNLFDTANVILADVLVTQGARTTTVIVMPKIFWLNFQKVILMTEQLWYDLLLVYIYDTKVMACNVYVYHEIY